MMGAHSQPATHGHSKKSPESSAEKMPGPSISSSTTPQGPHGWREGEGGKRDREEKTGHNLRDTQQAFLPRGECSVGSWSQQRSIQLCTRNTGCSWHVARNWTRPGAVGLSVVSLHVPSHSQLVRCLGCPSCEEARLKKAWLEVRRDAPSLS